MKTMMMIPVAAAALCAAMFAQSPVDRVTVHFSTPVEISGTTVPAGDCSIQIIHGLTDPMVLMFRPESGKPMAAMVHRLSDQEVEDAMTDNHARVVLNRHDNAYRLDRILLPDGTGYQVLPASE